MVRTILYPGWLGSGQTLGTDASQLMQIDQLHTARAEQGPCFGSGEEEDDSSRSVTLAAPGPFLAEQDLLQDIRPP